MEFLCCKEERMLLLLARLTQFAHHITFAEESLDAVLYVIDGKPIAGKDERIIRNDDVLAVTACNTLEKVEWIFTISLRLVE